MSIPREGTTLDPWYEQYATRTAGLSGSEVRSLFAVASRPEVVSLAGGMPFVSALPLDSIGSAMERVMADRGATALQYGAGQGTPELRERILEVMALEGIHAGVDDVVVTTGSQQALDLVAKLFLDPGDVVLAESPSYVGAIGIFRSYQAEVSHVAMDADGMIPAALTERILSLRAAGRPIKLLYLIPNFQNPGGVTLSSARRLEIIDIARSHGILILEDNPYGLLWFDQAPPQAMRSVETDGIVYLGSFSKTLAPGFRVGWALAPHGIREKLVLAAEASILSPSVLNQMVITDYLTSADWRGQIDVFRGLYKERRDAMIDALNHYLPDLTWTMPGGGFYVWLTLSPGLDAKGMLPRAVKELVAYTPGTAFFADGAGRQHLRLAFCYPTPTDIREGIRRLSTVVRQEQELLETFAPTGPIDQVPDQLRLGSHVISPPPNLG
ncbi:PLP-dependent aminotransferase family protein [Microcella sp.]|uniref:aminotransferase-like domain-containing protein n=1 Tax=Microcella sp. TaxID=1913979 RepID=UPI00391B64D6